MDGVTPFGEEAAWEIRQVALFAFGGGSFPEEVRELLPRWGGMLAAFQAAVNPMSGAIQHLPCAGAMLDQPSKTMAVWTILREVFVEKMPKGDGLTGAIRGG